MSTSDLLWQQQLTCCRCTVSHVRGTPLWSSWHPSFSLGPQWGPVYSWQHTLIRCFTSQMQLSLHIISSCVLRLCAISFKYKCQKFGGAEAPTCLLPCSKRACTHTHTHLKCIVASHSDHPNYVYITKKEQVGCLNVPHSGYRGYRRTDAASLASLAFLPSYHIYNQGNFIHSL